MVWFDVSLSTFVTLLHLFVLELSSDRKFGWQWSRISSVCSRLWFYQLQCTKQQWYDRTAYSLQIRDWFPLLDMCRWLCVRLYANDYQLPCTNRSWVSSPNPSLHQTLTLTLTLTLFQTQLLSTNLGRSWTIQILWSLAFHPTLWTRRTSIGAFFVVERSVNEPPFFVLSTIYTVEQCIPSNVLYSESPYFYPLDNLT